MNKSYTRLLSFLLSLLFCISVLPVGVFAEDGPAEWPQLASLTLSEGAQLVPTDSAPASNNRDITNIHLEQYNTPQLTSGTTYSVGKVTLYISEALSSSYQYKIKDNSLVKTFTDLPEGVNSTGKFEPTTKFTPSSGIIKGRPFAQSAAYKLSLIHI